MIRLLVLAAALVLAWTGAAEAMRVDGVSITMSGAPACYRPNPMPDVVSGTFRGRLPALDGNTYGSVNPWGSFQFARFRGATYGALFGSPDAPTLVVYDNFPMPQTGLSFVWGSPDWSNTLVLKRNGNVVASINGTDIAAAFGWAKGLNLVIKLPGGETFDKAVFLGEGGTGLAGAFEIANLNAVCR